MKKQLQAEMGMAELDKRIAEFEGMKKEQTNKIIELRSKIDAIDQRCASLRNVDDQKRKDEVKNLNDQALHLDHFLKLIQQRQWMSNPTGQSY